MEIGNCNIKSALLNQNQLNELVNYSAPFIPTLFGNIGVFWQLEIERATRNELKESYLKTALSFSSEEIAINSIGLLIGIYTSIVREYSQLFTLHSSAITKDGRSVLFIGDSFSGKSTLAVIGAKCFDFLVSSLNNTCLTFHNGARLEGGSTVLTVRRSINKILPESTDSGEDENFTLIKSPILEKHHIYNHCSEVAAVFFLVPWGRSLEIKKIDGESISVNLFDYSSRLQRTSVIFGDQGVISRIWDDEYLTRSRFGAVSKSAKYLEAYYITGTPYQILNHIEKKYF